MSEGLSCMCCRFTEYATTAGLLEGRTKALIKHGEVALFQGEFKNIQPRTSQRLEMKQTEWMKTQPGEDDRPVGTYPLVIKTSGTGQQYYDYKPWSFGDLETAAKQFPNITAEPGKR